METPGKPSVFGMLLTLLVLVKVSSILLDGLEEGLALVS